MLLPIWLWNSSVSTLWLELDPTLYLRALLAYYIMDNNSMKETTKNFLSIYLYIYLPWIWILLFKPFPVFFPYTRDNCFLAAHMLKIRKTSVALWAVSRAPIRARVSNIISYLLLYGTWVTNVSKEIMISIYIPNF